MKSKLFVMPKHLRFSRPAIIYGHIVIFVLVLSGHVYSDFDVCNVGEGANGFKFTHANCPYGVLFSQPVTAFCMASSNEPEHFITDVCEPEKFMLNLDDRPYKIQLAFYMNEDPVDDQNTCLVEGPDKCNVTNIIEASTSTLTEPQEDEDEIEGEKLTDEEKLRQNDTAVLEQTERLFKYMLGIYDDPLDGGPNMRLAKMLTQSFKILGRFCDTKYVTMNFARDILKAFLFLIRESEISRLQDISVQDYEAIKSVMDDCERNMLPFNFTGKVCKTFSHIQSIERDGKTMRYTKDEFSFQWGKHDIAIDATWATLSFVHGMCYKNHKSHVNFHHLFQRALETLFTKEIIYRWNHPPKLEHEDLWDHVYSASVKNSMRNLDACVYAAYHGSPFQHRLERPLLKSQANATNNATSANKTVRRRKRRALTTMTLDEGGLEGAGWCFQSEEDLIETTKAFVSVNCPDTTKAVDEMIRIRELLVSVNDTNGVDPTDTMESPPDEMAPDTLTDLPSQ